jgi:hypothetical protein
MAQANENTSLNPSQVSVEADTQSEIELGGSSCYMTLFIFARCFNLVWQKKKEILSGGAPLILSHSHRF